MANLKCFSIDGVRLWFWPNDHDPPHFHAQRAGDWEIRVNFLESSDRMFDVKWSNKRLSGADRKLLEANITQFRVELLQEWESNHPNQ
jgi:Domain of unknown function (DUF4160)